MQKYFLRAKYHTFTYTYIIKITNYESKLCRNHCISHLSI